MKVIFATLIILGISSLCHPKNLVDYRITLHATAQPPQNCTTSGLFCETCSDLVACIRTDDNTLEKTNVETCPSGQKCLKGECTSQYDPFCDGTADLDFPCKEVGVFPDPFYCNKFILCVNVNGALKAYPNKCEEGLSYGIGTGLCDAKLDGGKCADDGYPLPLCEYAGQSKALMGRPQQYYTCEQYSTSKEVLYPVVNSCPGALSYNDFVCG